MSRSCLAVLALTLAALAASQSARGNDPQRPNIVELYNIGKDPNETTDLRQREPAIFAELKQAIVAMDAQVKAEGPAWWKLEAK